MKYLLLAFLMCFSAAGFAQADGVEAAYKRFPTLPPIQLLLGDSATKYNKENLPRNKPVWVMVFSPECSHCKQTAEELLLHKDEFKNIQIVMATMYPLSQMNEFAATYKLNTMPNVVVGKDVYFLLPPFYEAKSLPFQAFYNKKGALISVFEGSMPIAKVLQIFNNTK